MTPKLPLDQMSIEEKLGVMELLWDDLCRRVDDIPSPAWHGAILADREAALANGEDVFEDWEAAKKSIRDELS